MEAYRRRRRRPTEEEVTEEALWARRAIAAEAGLRLAEFVERVEAGIRTDGAFLAEELPGITKKAKRITLEAHDAAPLSEFSVLELRVLVHAPGVTP